MRSGIPRLRALPAAAPSAERKAPLACNWIDDPTGPADGRVMHWAICNEIFKDWPLEKAFPYIAKAGYEGV